MVSEAIKSFILENREKEATSFRYLAALRKFSNLSVLPLFMLPFVFVFLDTFFAYDVVYPILSIISYWALLFFVIQRRFLMERKFREYSFDFRFFMANHPLVPSYYKYGVFTTLIVFVIMILSYFSFAWYSAVALLILFTLAIELIFLWSPYGRLARKTRPIESQTIISRLNEICQSLGIPEITPRVAETEGMKIANALCYGILKPRIYITDYFLDNVSEEEAVALLSHELSHLANHDGLKRLIPLVTVFGIIQSIALVSGLAFAGLLPIKSQLMYLFPSIIVLSVIGVFLTFVLISALARKQEFSADMFAGKFSGFDVLPIGILKGQYLNMVPVSYAGGSHPMVMTRIERMQNVWDLAKN